MRNPFVLFQYTINKESDTFIFDTLKFKTPADEIPYKAQKYGSLHFCHRLRERKVTCSGTLVFHFGLVDPVLNCHIVR